jgi:hypothetical protein
MSVTTNHPPGLNLPRPKPPIVPATPENVRDSWALSVNRKAYTRQSANSHPGTPDGIITTNLRIIIRIAAAAGTRPGYDRRATVGLYAINPQSQRCKWIAIDADYDDAFFDLGKLKGELELTASRQLWRCRAVADTSGSSVSNRYWHNSAGSTSITLPSG